jgi:ureidoacrylate peracid hydrolase
MWSTFVWARRDSWGVCADRVDLRREPAPAAPVTVAATPQTVTLDLARTAIIVVDMQNHFCHRDGWLASSTALLAGER